VVLAVLVVVVLEDQILPQFLAVQMVQLILEEEQEDLMLLADQES
jgi:hypothetical protein